jgi:hypothetical protein
VGLAGELDLKLANHLPGRHQPRGRHHADIATSSQTVLVTATSEGSTPEQTGSVPAAAPSGTSLYAMLILNWIVDAGHGDGATPSSSA